MLNPLNHRDIQVIEEEANPSYPSYIASKKIYIVEYVYKFLYICPG